MDASGKLVMESILETKASTLLQFLAGLRGNLSVTLEEGTWAAWLYDVLKPHVTHLVICNPRKNALLKTGSKSDRIDARKLAELLRGNLLESVYHGETGVRMLRELARSYLTIVEDQISDEPTESVVSQLGHCVCRTGRLLHPASGTVVGQAAGTGRPPPRRTTL